MKNFRLDIKSQGYKLAEVVGFIEKADETLKKALTLSDDQNLQWNIWDNTESFPERPSGMHIYGVGISVFHFDEELRQVSDARIVTSLVLDDPSRTEVYFGEVPCDGTESEDIIARLDALLRK